MLIQIEDLFINTDNIVTLKPYEKRNDHGNDFGLTINNENYTIFRDVDLSKTKEAANKINNLISIIIKDMTIKTVQRISLEEKGE